MWDISFFRKIPIVDAIFLIAVLLGPAASYSKLYLFHLVLVALLLRSTVLLAGHGEFSTPRSLRCDIAFFLFFLGWYGLSILWAQDKLYALQYCVYVGLGVLTVYYTTVISRTLGRLRAALWVIMATISLQIVLAVMESMRLIRLPFSPYSPYRWIFGREPNSFEGLQPAQIEQVLSMPTGFAGNPNNLAAFLVLALPLFLFSKRWWVAALGASATYFIIDMANARAGVIGFWVVMALGIMLYSGNRIRTTVISALVGVMIIGGGLPMPQISVPVEEAASTPSGGQDASDSFSLEGAFGAASQLFRALVSGREESSASVGVRAELILNGLMALRESHGLGVGAGGSLTVQENAASQRTGNIGSMHNFWVELLVDGGVLFATLFFVWCGWLVWRLWRIGHALGEPILRYLGQALSLGFVGFFFSAIGPSSVVYMLPMWMMIGLALAVIWLNAREATASISTGAPAPLAGASQ